MDKQKRHYACAGDTGNILVAIFFTILMIGAAAYSTQRHANSSDVRNPSVINADTYVWHAYRNVQDIRPLDCTECEIIHRSSWSMYYKKDGAIYYQRVGQSDDILVTHDVERFEVLVSSSTPDKSSVYALDSEYVYMNGEVVTGADVHAFRLLGITGYATDGLHMFWHEEIILDADPKSFTTLSTTTKRCTDCFSAYDKNAIYVWGQRTPFVTEERTLWLDEPIVPDSSVYEFTDKSVRRYANIGAYQNSRGQTFTDADPNSFSIITDEYARDNEHVYVVGNLIEGANASTFEILGRGYARDSERVYLYSREIENADSATFRVVEGEYAIDAQYIFWRGRIIPGISSNNYELRDLVYVLDDTHAYMCLSRLDVCEGECGGAYEDCILLEDVNTSNFQVIFHRFDGDRQSHGTVWSYATNGVIVWHNGQEYAAYEHDARQTDKLDVIAGNKILVRNSSTFANGLTKISHSNYFLYNSAVWYAYSVGEYLVADESVRGSERDLFDYFVLDYVSDYASEDDVELYRCDYIRIGNHVFGETRLLEGANPATFQVLGDMQCMYAKDESHVYYFSQEMKDALAPSFELDPVRHGWAIDHWYSYEGYYQRGYRR